ncbi:hypothetical protein [Falsiroseomonas selenitidurans]|uniref:Uncharacterized protein n=1 Tax=Falsiroseomonas selenitidurans TaxID=2716335 RepID=A0ABX1E8C5_9PROT|nr:hypothetical protein [Falsiroseomonas selenitidurans]NKC33479.1 hypothetical protein [Falsiroseomonas selenitidurans]
MSTLAVLALTALVIALFIRATVRRHAEAPRRQATRGAFLRFLGNAGIVIGLVASAGGVLLALQNLGDRDVAERALLMIGIDAACFGILITLFAAIGLRVDDQAAAAEEQASLQTALPAILEAVQSAALRAEMAPVLARLRESLEEEVASTAFRLLLEARRAGQPLSEAYAIERATRDVAYHRQRMSQTRHG